MPPRARLFVVVNNEAKIGPLLVFAVPASELADLRVA
jgi:hypothetical protein